MEKRRPEAGVQLNDHLGMADKFKPGAGRQVRRCGLINPMITRISPPFHEGTLRLL